MTPERLAQLEAHFKNPPSATCNAEWALELIEALRPHIAAPVAGVIVLPPPMAMSEPESKPTPPASPKAEKKTKK